MIFQGVNQFSDLTPDEFKAQFVQTKAAFAKALADRRTKYAADGADYEWLPGAQGQPKGTLRNGTCGVFTDEQGFQPPPGPWPIKPNGNCMKDPKGFYPHTPTFEACVDMIKSKGCTMAKYISWGGFNLPQKIGGISSAPFESMCAWFSECDFAHLCVDCSKATGPQCPATKWKNYASFTSIKLEPASVDWRTKGAVNPNPTPTPNPNPNRNPNPNPNRTLPLWTRRCGDTLTLTVHYPVDCGLWTRRCGDTLTLTVHYPCGLWTVDCKVR